MENKLWVCFTMDVERIAQFSPPGGPENLEVAHRSVDSYCQILADNGFFATLFIVPEAAYDQRQLLKQKAVEGHELGLHFHDQSFLDHWKNPDLYDYLGGYTLEIQRGKLLEAKKIWINALETEPKTMRPGNFSANDSTFPLLTELGFTHGSVSQPGRNWNIFKANWENACRNVHRGHCAYRLVEGDLDFVEIPVTTGNESMGEWGFGDIRLEGADIQTIINISRNDIERQINEGISFKHLCYFTHNTVNYYDKGNRESYRGDLLTELLAALKEMSAARGLELEGATTRSLREAYTAQTMPQM